jgi:RNA polymerase subunit RPABC4/transcription elongation factor Spt4
MALISCPECGKDVSEYAVTCPNCGVNIKLMKEKAASTITNCSECDTEIPDQAEMCPNCGAPIKRKTKNVKVPKTIRILLLLLVAAIVFGGIGAFILYQVLKINSGSEDTPSAFSSTADGVLLDETNTRELSNNDMIWEMTQLAVAENLKSPETAEFEDISRVSFFLIANDTYEIMGIVRGHNSYGVMVSNNFCATVIVDSSGVPTIVSNVDFLGSELYEERINLNMQLQERVESGQTYLTANELEQNTRQQPLYVRATRYISSDEFQYTRSAMLQADLHNNGNVAIKSAVIGFVAWDRNRLPIKIKDRYSISDGDYFSRIHYDAINLMPNSTYVGRDGDTYSGMTIDDNLDVSYIKAIVISYEDINGNIWDNPLLLDFLHLYEEKRLN